MAPLAAYAVGANASATAASIANATANDNAAPAPAGDNTSGSGAAKAAAAGIPIDTSYLRDHPNVGDTVPLGPPVNDGNRMNIDLAFSGKKSASTIQGGALAGSDLNTRQSVQTLGSPNRQRHSAVIAGRKGASAAVARRPRCSPSWPTYNTFRICRPRNWQQQPRGGGQDTLQTHHAVDGFHPHQRPQIHTRRQSVLP